MSFKNIKFSAPVESLSGRMNKGEKLTFFQGKTYKQRSWGVGSRNMVNKPLTVKEQYRREMFRTIAPNVTARMKQESDTYQQDLRAFLAQRDLPNGKTTFRAWLWQAEQTQYIAENPLPMV